MTGISPLGLKITYAENNASKDAICAHLENCSSRFVPPLHSQVDIDAYSHKLFGKAHRIEAWCEDELVGLLAFSTLR